VYELDNRVFWDFPGFNDQVDYFDLKFLSFVKALTFMCVLYDNDIKVSEFILHRC
jgi:hypothetical protein